MDHPRRSCTLHFLSLTADFPRLLAEEPETHEQFPRWACTSAGLSHLKIVGIHLVGFRADQMGCGVDLPLPQGRTIIPASLAADLPVLGDHDVVCNDWCRGYRSSYLTPDVPAHLGLTTAGRAETTSTLTLYGAI